MTRDPRIDPQVEDRLRDGLVTREVLGANNIVRYAIEIAGHWHFGYADTHATWRAWAKGAEVVTP